MTPTGKKKGLLSSLELPDLPSPNDLREIAEGIVEGLSEIKEIPKTLVHHLTEADQDFREADKTLRSTRLGGKKR